MAKYHIWETAVIERCFEIEADDIEDAMELYAEGAGEIVEDDSVHPDPNYDWEFSDAEEVFEDD